MHEGSIVGNPEFSVPGFPGKPDAANACPLCGRNGPMDFLRAPDRFHWRKDQYLLKRCSFCTFVWLDRPPKPQEMARHYDADYYRTIAAGSGGSSDVRWRRQREIVMRHATSGAVLDIGCSTGAFLSTLKGGALNLYGIEMEPASAECARSASEGTIYVGDAMSAPFAPESFDVITCFDVLEHVYEPRLFLQRVFEWLKPGGIFLAQLPNIDGWEAKLFGTYWYGLELPRHLSHFCPASLRHITVKLGFEVLRIATLADSYVDRSVGFLGSKFGEMIGHVPRPQSPFTSRSILFRLLRKAAHLLLLKPIAVVAAASGAGPSLEGIFRKTSGPGLQRRGQ